MDKDTEIQFWYLQIGTIIVSFAFRWDWVIIEIPGRKGMFFGPFAISWPKGE